MDVQVAVPEHASNTELMHAEQTLLKYIATILSDG